MATKPFNAEMFTATEFSTAADKADFANKLAAFVESGFEKKRFTKKLYTRLSNCFGHIAHYDRDGFWGTWFATKARQRTWVQHIVSRYRPCGQADYTFVDMEREFISWLQQQPQPETKARFAALLVFDDGATEASAAAACGAIVNATPKVYSYDPDLFVPVCHVKEVAEST